MLLMAALAALPLVPSTAKATLSYYVDESTFDTTARYDAAVASIQDVTNRYNTYSPNGFGNYDIYVYYNSGIPTEQASYLGSVGVGGTWPNDRVIQHETNHYLGSGTTNNWYNEFTNNVWQGANMNALDAEFDGDGSVILEAGVHFYGYGLNYDTEVYSLNYGNANYNAGVNNIFMRNIALMYAQRQDDGVGSSANPWSATTATLTQSDPLGESAFNWYGLWSDNFFSHSGCAYSTGNFIIRTPLNTADETATTPNFTFYGDSLTINNTNGSAGGLQFQGIGTSSTITVNNLILNGGYIGATNGSGNLFQLAGHITLASTGTIDAAQGNINIFSIISGSGSVTINGSGHTVSLDNANTFTGRITVTNGATLYANPGNGPNNKALSYASSITVNNGGTLESSANGLFGWDGTTERPITVNAGGTMTADSGADVGVSTVTLNGGTLTSVGTSPVWGSWRFDDATDRLMVTDNSTVSAVNVKFGSASAAIDVAAGKTLAFTGTVTDATSGGISYLTKIDSGAVNLSGSNTYSGATSVQGGRLALTGSGSINSTSAITVNGTGAKFVQDSSVTLSQPVTVNLGTFDGTGTTSSLITVNSGGVIANGDGTTGVLTPNAVTLKSGSAITPRIAGGASTTAYGIAVTNQLSTDANGAGLITLNLVAPGTSIVPNTYDLVHYGTFAGSLADFKLGTLTGMSTRQTATLVNDTANNALAINVVGLGGNLFWRGASSANWATGTTGNWSNTVNSNPTDNYFEGDAVTFDDGVGSGPTTISVAAGGVNPGAVNFNNSGAKTYTINGGAIGGITTNLTLGGAGKVILNTANTYGGTTTINSGTLQLGSGSTSGTLSASTTIVDNGSLVFNHTNTVTQGTDFGAAAITGNGSLVQNGTGTLVLTAANTYSGGTTVNAGTLQITTTAGAANNGTFNLGGGTFQINNGANANFGYAPTINLTANSTIGNAAPGFATFLDGQINLTGTINGGGKVLNIANTGLARLYMNGPVNNVSQINVLSGAMGFDMGTANHGGNAPVVVSNGAALWFANSGNAITNALTFNGGTGINGSGALYFEGGSPTPTAIPSAITLASGNTSVGGAYASDTITLSGPITGPGSLTKASSDFLLLSGGSNYSGGTTISSGTLIAGSTTALGTGTLTMNGGNFGTNAALTIGNTINVVGSSNNIGYANQTTDFTLSGSLTGSGTLTNYVGTSTGSHLIFTGNLSGFTGTINYTNRSGNDSQWWSAGSNNTVADLSNASVILNLGNVTDPTAFAKTFGFTDGISGAIMKLGALSGNGIFQASYNNAGPNTLQVGYLNTSTTFSGVLAGGNAGTNLNFIKVGTGTLILSGLNLLSGDITVNGGQLWAVTDIGTSYTSSNLGTLTPTSNRNITINSGASMSFAGGNVLGTGYSTNDLANITFNINGGALLTGLNAGGTGWWNKIGNVNLNGGAIHIGSGANNTDFQGLALIGTVTVTGTSPSTIDNQGASDSTENGIHLGQNDAAGQSITFNVADVTGSSAVDLTVTPALLDTSGSLVSSGFTKTGAGTMLLTGNSTFTGNVIINAGTVNAANGLNAFGRTNGPLGNPSISGRTVTINNTGTLALTVGNVLGSGGQTTAPALSFIVNQGGTLVTAAGAVGGSGGGDANIFGNVTLNGGTLTTSNGYNASYQSAILLGGVTVGGTTPSTINTNATNTTANGLMLGVSGGTTFNVGVTSGSGTDLTVSAPLADAAGGGVGALIKSGLGTMLLTGTSTYTGNTNVSAGTLTVSGSISGSNNITTAAGATLNASGASNAGLSTTSALTDNGTTNISANAGTGIRAVRMASVNIGATGQLNVASSSLQTNRSVLVTGMFTETGNGTLDLGANDMIVSNAGAMGLTNVINDIKSGFANGPWTGIGIQSSAAAGDSTHLTALGVILNNSTYGSAKPFDTITPGANDVLIKYTYYGDANLNGHVDGTDYSLIDTGYGSQTGVTPLTGWQNGDFNYDGHIDGSDYSLIDNTFNQQSSAGYAVQIATQTSEIASGSTSVPEPGSFGLLVLGSVAISNLATRRHRRSMRHDLHS
jgi:fibronectin-binding autotransporter adhesin